MPMAPPTQFPVTDMWNTFGHSYMRHSSGTFDQTGRLDARVRASLDIEYTNWRNYAIDGAQLTVQGPKQGGFARVYREKNYGVGRTATTGYTGDGGGAIFCWGINDLGGGAGAGASAAITRVAFTNALRAMISRWRMSTLYEDDFSVGTRTTYGAGFTNLSSTSDFSSGNSVRIATSTTNATITLTLPTDYNGEVVAISFVVDGGTSGGAYSISGTAGVTGTFDHRNIMPAFLSHGAFVYRIKGLSSANAGQTIILTLTAVTGDSQFDCWWLESKTPPPVIVVGTARLPDAGYTIYPSWAGSNAQKDQDVLDLNKDVQAVIAEFDAMVQYADIEAVLQKKSSLFGDSIHPNDLGAAKCADVVLAAIRRLTPSGGEGNAAYFNPPSPRTGGQLRPRVGGSLWYTADFTAAGVATALVAQEQWAIPFVVTSSRDTYTQMSASLVAGGTVAGTIRLGIYDDPSWIGYPQCLLSEPTSAAAVSTGTTSNAFITSPTFTLKLDPGLYWLSVKCITAGTSQTYARGNGPLPQLPNLASNAIFQANAGWRNTTSGTGACADVYPSGGVATTVAPVVSLMLQ
jgi:hypothetical protein